MQPTFIDAFSQPVALVPDSTALVVVDMQNATGNRSMGLGALQEAHGNAEESRYRFDRIEQLLVPNIARLADACRKQGVRVIYVTYGATLPDASDVPHHMSAIVRATNNIEGQPEHEIVAPLTPRAGSSNLRNDRCSLISPGIISGGNFSSYPRSPRSAAHSGPAC